MAFKMKNPSMAKLTRAAGNNRVAMKMKMEEKAAAKMASAMKMKKDSAMKKDEEGQKAYQYSRTPEYKAYLEARKKFNKEQPGHDAAYKPFEGTKYTKTEIDRQTGKPVNREAGEDSPSKMKKSATKFNDELKAASKAGKLSGKFKEAVDSSPAKLLGRKKKKSEGGVTRSVTKTSGYGLQPTVTQTSSTKKDGKFVRTTTNTADRPLAKEKHEYLKKEGKFPSAQAEADHAKKNKVYSSTVTKQATKKGKKTFTAADGNPKYMTKTKTKKDGTVKTKKKRYRKNVFKGQPGVRPL